jgi:sec-independent protein translocase protein TatA
MTLPLAPVLGGILGPIGWPEILVILFVVMLLFGAKKLPELAKGFGKSIREFKKATAEIDEDEEEETAKPSTAKNGTAAVPKSDPAAKN